MQALYIHLPFCEKKCLFCSFVVSVGQEKRVDQYVDCLLMEAEKYSGTRLKTLYFGGGTPTYLNEDQLTKLKSQLEKYFTLEEGAEVTIEANPEGITRKKAAVLKKLGFNRVSLGVQSLDDQYLKMLGRCHESVTALEAFHNLRAAGFDNVNLDLMFSFPKQTKGQLIKDIQAICSLKSEHLSLYSLTVEQNSRFYTKRLQLEDEAIQADFYSTVILEVERNGLEQYEVSNFSKPGRHSRHNFVYWTGGDYIGLGVGAHSHCGGKRWWNVSRLMDYINRVKAGDSPQEDSQTLSLYERLIERVLLGLRMNQGVNISEQEAGLNCRLQDDKKGMISDMIREGYLVMDEKMLKATPKGRLVLDEISARLF